jgi:hypothetical protein
MTNVFIVAQTSLSAKRRAVIDRLQRARMAEPRASARIQLHFSNSGNFFVTGTER